VTFGDVTVTHASGVTTVVMAFAHRPDVDAQGRSPGSPARRHTVWS
jgi:hypothetical protein